LNLVLTFDSVQTLEWLVRLDAATSVIMAIIAVYYLNQFVRERISGTCDRPLQLMLAFAGFAAWTALELFWLTMARVTLLQGERESWWVNSGVRLIVPALGLILALSVWTWIASSGQFRRWRGWLISAGCAIAATLLIWPQPVTWTALLVHRFVSYLR
jgi:hypothetical protein